MLVFSLESVRPLVWRRSLDLGGRGSAEPLAGLLLPGLLLRYRAHELLDEFVGRFQVLATERTAPSLACTPSVVPRRSRQVGRGGRPSVPWRSCSIQAGAVKCLRRATFGGAERRFELRSQDEPGRASFHD